MNASRRIFEYLGEPVRFVHVRERTTTPRAADPVVFQIKSTIYTPGRCQRRHPTRPWTAQQALKYVTDPLSPPGAPVMFYSNSNYLLLSG